MEAKSKTRRQQQNCLWSPERRSTGSYTANPIIQHDPSISEGVYRYLPRFSYKIQTFQKLILSRALPEYIFFELHSVLLILTCSFQLYGSYLPCLLIEKIPMKGLMSLSYSIKVFIYVSMLTERREVIILTSSYNSYVVTAIFF